MTNRSDEEPAELSSPACSMREAGDTYMGYAGEAELIAFLNELLEAERAGARVALKSSNEAGVGSIAELMQAVQRDEARWCAMLIRHLKALGEIRRRKSGPSTTRRWRSRIWASVSSFSTVGKAG